MNAIDDDPVLGTAIVNFPSNRARLLLIGGAIVGAVWLIVTFALLNVEETQALIITVVIIGAVTVGVGWYIAHLWNREVVLFDKGFSYREGSYNAYFRYQDIASFRQLAERRAYFGGLIRRNVYRFTLKTIEDETIVLNNVYLRIDELGTRLEKHVNAAIRARMEQKLASDESFPFSTTLSVSSTGLQESERGLRWSDFGGYKIQNGQLNLFDKRDDALWYKIPLAEVDNLALLLDVLKSSAK